MTKKDLMTGDIIVNRGGYLGVVLKENDSILYQLIGSDSLSDFNDDLTFDDASYREGDIMQVYRDSSFLDVDNGDAAPVYQRDFSWHRPSNEERKACEKALEEERQKNLAEMRKKEESRNLESIYVIAQHFYGNRTATEIKREDINFFLKGILSPELFSKEDETVDRKLIVVPHTENIAIVFDQNQENDCIANGETNYVSCESPEIGFKIHSRCFACRIDENGELQTLEKGDSKYFINYFTM